MSFRDYNNQRNVGFPELEPGPYLQPGSFLNWRRRTTVKFTRPNDTTEYAPHTFIGKDATGARDSAVVKLPDVANPGQRVNLRILVIEGRSYNQPALRLGVYIWNKQPSPYTSAGLTGLFPYNGLNALVTSQDFIEGVFQVPVNKLDDGGGFPNAIAMLGGDERSRFPLEGFALGAASRAAVVPYDGILMAETNLYLALFVVNGYVPAASLIYSITPYVQEVG